MTNQPTLESISTKQTRIAKLAKQMPTAAIRSLSHHMDLPWLRDAFRRTRKDGAPGIDEQTAQEYAADLDDNLTRVLGLAKSGAYRAPPVRRVHIPKGPNETRPLGIPTFEDKVLQRAVVMLLEPLYEQDFYDFSYGFRPGRSAHDALEVVNEGIFQMGGGWVLDVDISSFFDSLDHAKLRALFRQRVVDGVVARLIGKWLRAGVLEGGVVTHLDKGTPQGGVISPLLANIYLHEVLDRWWAKMVTPRLRGRAFLVRYADDFVIVFSDRRDALRVQEVLPKRFARFGLTVHPGKTKLIRFERPRHDHSGPRPGSFNFLGFTHYWGRSRRGKWIPKRKTAKDRLARGLRRISEWMRRARHLPIAVQATTLRAKLRGHFQYYGIRGNSSSLSSFQYRVLHLWRKWLSRRSNKATLTWEAFLRLLARYPLPSARLPIRHLRRQLRLANL